MKRRDFLRGVVAGSAGGALLTEGNAMSKPTSPRPNVLIIHTDEHRIDCLGAYGNKQIKTPHVDALAADGVRYTNDGFVVRPDATEMPEKAWTASLEAVDTVVKGYPISPRGVAIQRRVSLSLSQWECLTRPESYTMDMHIPAGGDMTPERCVNSFRKGVEFFRRFFPNKPFQTVSSASWIFGPQLEEILPPEANLVRHMRELYLFPLPCGPDAGLWFVFLLHPVDPTTAPRDTSLRRAVADYLAEGKPWYAGGMFFVVDDLGLYGTQHYRTQWPDVLRAVE